MKKKVTKKKAHITGLQIRRLLIAIITAVVLFGIMSIAVTPPRYDISVGQPAPNTIKASKDVTDLKTTEKLRNEAAATVKSIYYYDDSAAESLRGKLDMIFRSLRTVMTVSSNGSEPVWDSEANAGVALTDNEIKIFCGSDENTLISLETTIVSLATEVLENKLDDNHVEAALASIREGLTSAKFDSKLVDAAMSILSQTLEPNYFYDAESTEAARQAERDKVAVVSRIKGEVIVSDGEIVTEAQYAMLAQLGMIKESSMDIYLYVGIGSIVLLLVLSSALYIKLFCKTVYENTKMLLMVAIICVLSVGTCVIARTVTVYVMPVTLGMLMITILVQRRLALYLNLMLAIIASLLGSTSGSLVNMSSYSVFVCATVGGIVAHTILKNKQNRAAIMLAGLLIGIANAVTTFCVGLVASSNMMDSIICSGYAGCSGLLAAIICVALTPLFEAAFNAVTTTRLIELSNPNHPLLRRLLLEAPGTYHHSIIVANLAEAAAGEIGANALLARVGAYYHDVGKLKRPLYFKENQFEDNPHDRTDPRVSCAIITSHAKDGLALLKEYRIPEEIQEIVISHHGDTPVMYFYSKAKADNADVDISDFRYPGPRPSSREAALVMLADTIEAAARTLKEPNAQSMRELIEKLIYQKMSDGQLSECALTFSDIGKCITAFVTVLSGAFHERIEYPTIEIPKRTEGAQQ